MVPSIIDSDKSKLVFFKFLIQLNNKDFSILKNIYLVRCKHQISSQWFVVQTHPTRFKERFVKKTQCNHFPTCERRIAQGTKPIPIHLPSLTRLTLKGRLRVNPWILARHPFKFVLGFQGSSHSHLKTCKASFLTKELHFGLKFFWMSY
jgi:hypothetical protein